MPTQVDTTGCDEDIAPTRELGLMMAISMPEITEKNTPEVYARLSAAYAMDILHEPMPLEDVEQLVGLKVNVKYEPWDVWYTRNRGYRE